MLFSNIIEIFRWRELLYNLIIRDLKAKYTQATGGFGWMLIKPLAQMLIFYFVFGLIFKVRIDKYPLFLLSGLFPWGFLHASLDAAANSIVNNSNLIKKSYFPRQIIPISVVLCNLISFALSLMVLFLLSLFSGVNILHAIIWLPVVLAAQLILTQGLAFLVASLNACFREVQFIMDTLILIWFYATPIIYSLNMAQAATAGNFAKLYFLNPATGIIFGYQNIFVYGARPDLGLLLNSLFLSSLCLIFGSFIFRYYEDVFVDII